METELTPEMMATGSWKAKQFKPYNLDASAPPAPTGHMHPLLKFREEYRKIFIDMG